MLALTEAVNACQTEKLKGLLPQLEDQERQDWFCKSLLRAAYENRAEAVRVLLEVKASPSVRDELGKTALHWAARQAHEAVAKILVESGGETNAANQDGATALHFAAEHNAASIARLLLGNGANPAAVTSDKRTALHLAAEQGSAVAAAVLLDGRSDGSTRQSLLEMESDRGETPMARAATRGHAPVVQLLLRAKADAEHRNWWGQSPLQLASYTGHVACAAVLIDGSSEVNGQAQDGTTPLHTACERGHAQVVELLLSHAADVKITSAGGRTALHGASERGCAEAVDALIAHGADPDARTDEARTAISLAAARGHRLVVERLIDGFADIQALDNVQQTPLHAAAASGRAQAIDALTLKRARLEDTDAAGRTPMMLALAGKQDAAIRMLLKRGAHMDEEVASTPEMQRLIAEVESEVIAEQMKEAAAGINAKQLKLAEKEFEDARLKLLQLIEQGTLAYAAPSLHAAELKFQDAVKLAKDRMHAENVVGASRKVIADDVAAVMAQVEDRKRSIAEMEKKVKKLEDQVPIHERKLRELARAIESELESARKADAKHKDLTKTADSWEKKIPPEEAKIVQLDETGVSLAAQLEKVRKQLHQWTAEKDQASSLHQKAQDLLNRNVNVEFKPGGRPSP